MLGSWDINVVISGMPQKVATAFGKLAETLMGAEYEPIAYLGSQVANGTNHAVLAKQVIVTGRDAENIVLVIFNEKPNAMEATLVGIERIVEGGQPMGGIAISGTTEIDGEAKEAWDAAFEGFTGSNVVPFALLGTQVTKGVDYIFAATVTPVVEDPKAKVELVVVNGMKQAVYFTDLLSNKVESVLGYAFTWLG